tara:strand:- start:8842 stop:9417 length:576 start_codon:yes stop_codon:yes gene_type:complete
MATFSQLIGQQISRQKLGQAESGTLLGMSAADSKDLVEELQRAYGESTGEFRGDLSDFEKKGEQIDTAQTLLSLTPLGPIASAGIGLLGRGMRDKPKFKLDIEKAAPGFADRLFSYQAGETLISNINQTKRMASDALQGSFFYDIVSVLGTTFDSYQTAKNLGRISDETSFGDFLKGISDATEDETETGKV